jgi:hypothetical protein
VELRLNAEDVGVMTGVMHAMVFVPSHLLIRPLTRYSCWTPCFRTCSRSSVKSQSG